MVGNLVLELARGVAVMAIDEAGARILLDGCERRLDVGAALRVVGAAAAATAAGGEERHDRSENGDERGSCDWGLAPITTVRQPWGTSRATATRLVAPGHARPSA